MLEAYESSSQQTADPRFGCILQSGRDVVRRASSNLVSEVTLWPPLKEVAKKGTIKDRSHKNEVKRSRKVNKTKRNTIQRPKAISDAGTIKTLPRK